MKAIGYDGHQINVGDRVELHPGTDLWMRGARYGTVTMIVPTPADKIRVELDAIPGRIFAASSDTCRKVK